MSIHPSVAASPFVALAPAAQPTLRILIADDERTLRESCATVLQGEGYNVTVSARGDDALDLLQRQSFDVALVDLYMSHVPGMDLLRAALTAQARHGTSGWTPPKTPDGQPSLQGVWTNATITPFERPPALAAKAFLTEAEAAQVERQAASTRDEEAPPRAGDVGNYNQVWFDSGDRVVSTRRTSLVVDPPGGRVPLRPEAEASRDYASAHQGDSFEFMSVWDRCITRGVPGGMFPAGYNNAYQIVQTPGYVMIHYEMIHEPRIIPIDGRPHLPQNIRQWMGDSRGHWEGKTLVVDTTNLNAKSRLDVIGDFYSENAHIVEKFIFVDDKTMTYEATITDPTVFTRPWTLRIPQRRMPDDEFWEFACHEGNLDPGVVDEQIQKR